MSTTTERLLALADEYDQKAQALRLAAHELNGHQTAKKQAASNGTFSAAIALRRTQRGATNGHGTKFPPSRQKQHEAGLAKARVVATILKNAKRAIPIKELSALAREGGVKSLTGIHNYVRSGYLTRSGNKKSNYAYSFKAMPPEVSNG